MQTIQDETQIHTQSQASKKTRVLMVCLGNICRSPTAHGVFQHILERDGLTHLIAVDSAGTASYHQGNAPDGRSIEAALKRGYDLSSQRARQVCEQDLVDFDYILAMDEQNLDNLLALQKSQASTSTAEPGVAKIQLFLDYASSAYKEVPDPYYSGEGGFELVLDLVEVAAEGLLKHIIKHSQASVPPLNPDGQVAKGRQQSRHE
ncbi:MAG: phosphotyrosine protein phosphatase [SAR86 cluster bacterium]|uniref:Phosphotyrosine protein phosphatase n=1 Tax=SAR86 cluster bacterium TaxID=2030880 RepID=A0A2A4MF58_9GAMM|nr:MAG: phosphotyrosine protein phosphatase [SAR86 cluster bacterium]